jgi:hypothetical protein
MAQKGHNFLSDRWIALKFLEQCPEAISFEVVMESQRTKEEV